MFALCDGNNFYASCERLFRPELKGKAVVVLSNNDGCVIARSEEAKVLGIKMGEPEFLIRNITKKHEVHVFSSNYVLYGDLSQRMMQNIGRWCPKLTVYSIDEAFGWLHGVSNLDSYVQSMRNSVIQNTGIPISIGVAPSLTLAKMANKLAKKRNGTLVLDTPERIAEAVEFYPVEDLWGIGRQYYNKLSKHGIKTAGDIRRMPEMWMKQHFTVLGLRMWNELWGKPALKLHDVADPKKGIMVSRSFQNYVHELEIMFEVITTHSSRLAEKLRENKLCCLYLEVFLFTNKHREDHPQDCPKLMHRLTMASNNTQDLVSIAIAIVRLLFKSGYRYRKAGVFASGLVPENEVQTTMLGHDDKMFDQEIHARKAEASKVIDKLNLAYGRGTIRIASAGYEKNWTLKQEFLSKGYTTRWSDIIKSK